MKISEVIDELTKIKKEHGDLVVNVHDYHDDCMNTLTELEVETRYTPSEVYLYP